MTKNLGNAKPSAPAREISPSLLSKAAPALFPLVVVVLGFLVGRHYFGFCRGGFRIHSVDTLPGRSACTWSVSARLLAALVLGPRSFLSLAGRKRILATAGGLANSG